MQPCSPESSNGKHFFYSPRPFLYLKRFKLLQGFNSMWRIKRHMGKRLLGSPAPKWCLHTAWGWESRELRSLGYVSKFCFYAWILPFLDEGIHYYFQLWVVTISWSLGLGVSSLHVSCLIFMSHLCWGSLGSMCLFGVLFCALCHVKQNKTKLKEEKREKKREK